MGKNTKSQQQEKTDTGRKQLAAQSPEVELAQVARCARFGKEREEAKTKNKAVGIWTKDLYGSRARAPTREDCHQA